MPRRAADIVQLRRDDLAALAVSSQTRARSTPWLGALIPASGLATFAALIGLQEIGGIAALSDSRLYWCWCRHLCRRRRSRVASRTDAPGGLCLRVSACGLDIISPKPWVEDGPRAELVIASGCCPGCGARIVAD